MSNSIVAIGDHPQTLAVVRSLGRAGYRVIVAHDQRRAVAELSRYCSAAWRFNSLSDASFVPELVKRLRTRDDVQCLFPIGEPAIEHVNRARACLPGHVGVAAVSQAIFDGCVDKEATHTMAKQAGIRVPEGRVVKCHSELLRAATEIGFPVIVKTLKSEALVLGRKAFLAMTEKEFRKAFARWPGGVKQLLVQRYIAGERLGCDFVAHDGHVVAYYQGEAVRTDMPDDTGFAVSFRSRPPDREMFKALQKFARTHNYSGPGLLQCIRCAETGELYFIEINPRLSAGVAEAIHAGVDLPLISVRAACGTDVRGVESHDELRYRIGSRTHWLERDLLGLLRNFRSMDVKSRLRWLKALAADLVLCHGHINWQWRDPMPSLLILGRHLRSSLSVF